MPRRASDATEPPTRLAGVSTEGGEALAAAVTDLLDDAQRELRWGAEAVVQEAIVDVGSFLELRVSRSGRLVSLLHAAAPVLFCLFIWAWSSAMPTTTAWLGASTAAPSTPACSPLPNQPSSMLQEVVEAGKWARGPWAGSPEDEQAILEVRSGSSLDVHGSQQHAGIALVLRQTVTHSATA